MIVGAERPVDARLAPTGAERRPRSAEQYTRKEKQCAGL